MIEDPVNVFWTALGLLVWPELTLGWILWKLGHPWLGLFALIFASTTSVKEVVKRKVVTRDRIVEAETGRVIQENVTTTESEGE